MNTLKPIDYIVYKISRVYRMGLDRRDPEIWVRNLLACWLMLNYATIILWTRSPNFFELFAVVIIGFMNLYYNKSRFLKIEERYQKEPPKQKLWGSVAVITYVVATIILFAYAIYYRQKLNGF